MEPVEGTILTIRCTQRPASRLRVSKLRGWVGQILGLMPLITINDGLLEVVDKVRGSRNGLEEILGIFCLTVPDF